MCTYCVQGSTVCQNLKGLGVKWSNKILRLLPGGRCDQEIGLSSEKSRDLVFFSRSFR